jgi:hypothetical protein
MKKFESWLIVLFLVGGVYGAYKLLNSEDSSYDNASFGVGIGAGAAFALIYKVFSPKF